MFSIQKILVLIAVVSTVWAIFKKLERWRSDASSRPRRESAAIDLKQCETCYAWVTVPCEKPDCPIDSG